MAEIAQVLVAYLQADTTLAALIGTRIYPITLPQEPTLPALTFRRVSSVRKVDHGGKVGYTLARYQFDCYGATYLQASEVYRRLDGALLILSSVNPRYAAFPETAQDDHNPELDQWTIQADYMIECEEVEYPVSTVQYMTASQYRDVVIGLSPLAYWTLDDANLAAAADSSGHGNTMQVVQYVTAQNGAPFLGGQTPAWPGTHADENIQIYSPLAWFPGNAGTISMWLYNTSADWTDGNARYTGVWQKSTRETVGIAKSIDAGRMGWTTAGAAAPLITHIYNMQTCIGWWHAAMSWTNGGVTKYYVGGKLIYTRAGCGAWTGDPVAGAAGIGGMGGGSWHGSIAHYAFFGSALSDAGIALLANTGIAAPVTTGFTFTDD